jgi:tRNA 2-thiouridine synthesizing protein A
MNGNLPSSKEINMTDIIKEDQVEDCSAMLCPMPIVKTSKAIKELQSGQILKLIATDPGSPPDMEAWSRQTGNELLRSTTKNGRHNGIIHSLRSWPRVSLEIGWISSLAVTGKSSRKSPENN